MNTWGGPEEQEILDDLVKEVPIAPEQPQVSNQSPVASVQVPPVSTPVLIVMEPSSTNVNELGELQARLTAVRANGPTMNVSQGMVQGSAQNSTAEKPEKTAEKGDIPSSPKLPWYPGLDGHPHRRITPIPISKAQNQPSGAAVIKSPEEI